MDTLNYRLKTKLPSWQEMKKDGLSQKGNRFYKNIEREACTLKLLTSSYDQEFLNVEFSAPKLFYNTNVEMFRPTDLEYINDTVTSIVNAETRIPFEANEAELTRLDLAHNWKTPSETYAHAYRDAMKDVHIGKRLTQWISAKENLVDTVYWSNKSQEILLYPKYAETKRLAEKGLVSVRHLEQSRGMLRLEHRLLNVDVVNRELDRFGYINCAANVVPHLLEITAEIIESDMKKLGLNQPIEITGELERLKKLQERCGENTVLLEKLVGFLAMCDMHGEANLVGMGLINEKTFGKRKTELKKLGMPIAKPKHGYILPPLPVPSFEDAEKLFNKTNLSSAQRILPTSSNVLAMNVRGIH